MGCGGSIRTTAPRGSTFHQVHKATRMEIGQPSAPSLLPGRRCEICERLMPSREVLRAMTCSHALCRDCSKRYIEAELQKDDASFVRCPRASCDSVLLPDPFRGFVRPEVFHTWLSAHQRSHRVKLLVFLVTKALLGTLNDAVRAATAAMARLGNRKGKQPIEFPQSVSEIGGSSADDEFYCSICMETKPLHESFDINGCSHMFCMGCVGLYVAAKVGENSTTIVCPDPGCKDGNLEPDMCRSIVRGEVLDRWGYALCESALGTAKFYCPYKDCSALLSNEGGEGGEPAMTNVKCPHCKRVLCARCSVPWHEGIDCEEYQQLGEDERGREDLMLRQLAKGSKWQRCPSCRIYVEKLEGCSLVRCR